MAVVTIGGERIGLIGLATVETPVISSPGPNVKFADPVESATKAVAELSAQGINKIVCLSHMGYTEDKALAAAVDGIDVIIGGHSHTVLGQMEGADGPYPTVMSSPNGGTVLVVSAYEWGKYLGRLDVTFGAEGEVETYNGQPIAVDEEIAEDAEIAAEVAHSAQPIETLKNTVVGSTAVALDGVSAVEDVKGQFPQVGGLCFSMDPTQPAGSRILSVQVENEEGSFSALDMDAMYVVVSNDFMRQGGDGYTMFAERAVNPYDAGAVMADAVAEYIATMSPTQPEVEGRIVVGEALEAASDDSDPVRYMVGIHQA